MADPGYDIVPHHGTTSMTAIILNDGGASFAPEQSSTRNQVSLAPPSESTTINGTAPGGNDQGPSMNDDNSIYRAAQQFAASVKAGDPRSLHRNTTLFLAELPKGEDIRPALTIASRAIRDVLGETAPDFGNVLRTLAPSIFFLGNLLADQEV